MKFSREWIIEREREREREREKLIKLVRKKCKSMKENGKLEFTNLLIRTAVVFVKKVEKD